MNKTAFFRNSTLELGQYIHRTEIPPVKLANNVHLSAASDESSN